MGKTAVVDVKFKDLRVAVTALNKSGILEANKLALIELVGAEKEVILKKFMDAMGVIPDVEGKFPGPKEALAFNNLVLEMEEKAAKAAEAGTPEAGDGKTKGKKKAAGKKGEKKADKGPGVIESILEIIKEKGPITKEKILAALVKKFPDREEAKMAKTVQVQIGGKKQTRMEKEKKVKFVKSEKGEYSIK